MNEDQAVSVIREIWKDARTLEPRAGWPAGGPALPRSLTDHMSHFRTRGGVVYRSEPYGSFGREEIILLGELLEKWDIRMDPRGSTHHPGSTTQFIFQSLR